MAPSRAIRRRRRGSARTKNGQSSRADGGSMGPNALDRENRDAQTCVRSGQISPGRRCVPRQWQCHQKSFTRASDASPSWLGLPTLAGCGSLPQSVWLRYSPSQLLMQAGRSDLCSRHQHASSGHSACFVIRVTQLFQISQVYHQLARDAGLVALATAHASADLQLTNTASMQWVCGYATWVLLCQIARKWSKRALSLGLTQTVLCGAACVVFCACR